LLYGRHIELEFGIDVITILECVSEKRGRFNLLITDQNQACFTKMSTCRVQEELLNLLEKFSPDPKFNASTYKSLLNDNILGCGLQGEITYPR
jgi:hypothetical protein